MCNRLSGDSDYHLMSRSSFGDPGIDPRTSRMQSERSTI